LHYNSPRKKGPFVAVNAAAVPATLVESELFGHVRGAFTGATDKRIGRFEQADGGTLFIDEIGDFELGLQAKLLRVLETLTVTPVGGHEDRKVNVRVLAATRQDIRKMVAAGTFREDLYYRLNVVAITLPPLRQRVDDIPMLIEHFLRQMNAKSSGPPKRVSPDVMRRLLNYTWPGNVRELFHAIERMMVLSDSDMLVEADLPDEILESGAGSATPRELPTGLTMDELEKLAIIKALDACDGNRTHAAQRLNISVRTLQRKLQQYQLERAGESVAPTAEISDTANPA
jgi:transcriptional regulator with PAS, ATPase and Fis domain